MLMINVIVYMYRFRIRPNSMYTFICDICITDVVISIGIYRVICSVYIFTWYMYIYIYIYMCVCVYNIVLVIVCGALCEHYILIHTYKNTHEYHTHSHTYPHPHKHIHTHTHTCVYFIISHHYNN